MNAVEGLATVVLVFLCLGVVGALVAGVASWLAGG